MVKSDGEDRHHRNAGDLHIGEVGKTRRRLDLQPTPEGDVDRMDDEARRQRRDDRRDAQRPDQQIVGGADGSSRGQRGEQPERDARILAAHHRHRHRAGQPDIGRQRQVDIAGPQRDDEHLADADDHHEDGERQRRGDHAAAADSRR